MLFTDALFLFYFLPLALGLHWVVARLTQKPGASYGRPLRLLIFSLTLLFYGYKQPWWLVPFFISISFDFMWSRLLAGPRSERARRLICASSVVQNLSLLAILKYQGFALRTIGAVAPSVVAYLPQLARDGGPLPLPAGVSFYTFESMSFVIDVYRRKVAPPKSVLEFFAFIGMFPRFVAGPIVRYRDMVSQFAEYRGMDLENGLVLFMLGFGLKTCFADSFACFTRYAFGRVGEIEFLSAWVGALAYTMQLYFDFAGYSLMAIGLGRCLGFRFPTNFNRPYLAVSLQDFWRRWHISLSTWLRDYLYFPLGGSAHGTLETYRNVFLTMLLGGIWHGADWTFVAWGAWHGVFLCLERASGVRSRIATFLVVVFGWVLFKAATLTEAAKVMRAMANPFRGSLHQALAFNPGALRAYPIFSALAAFGLIYCFALEGLVSAESVEAIHDLPLWQRAAGLAAFTCSVALVFSAQSVPFIYFQF